MDKDQALVNIIILMVIYMKANGRMIWKRVKEYFTIFVSKKSIQDNLNKIKEMVLD